jgi:hypothetical protein
MPDPQSTVDYVKHDIHVLNQPLSDFRGIMFHGGFEFPKTKITHFLGDGYICLYGSCVIFFVIYVQLLKFNAQIWS